jgi:hypothetical protein
MKRYRLNKKRFAGFICSVVAVLMFGIMAVELIRFPECYSTTMRYQLKLDIENGDQEMIEYYERNYIENGRTLFED